MTERPLRVAVLSPQPAVAEALHAILGSMSGRVEFVLFDCSKPDPDVLFYDAIGLLCCAPTDLKMLIDKTTAHLFVISRELRPGLDALALAVGADGQFYLGADDTQILEAVESAVTDWQLADADESPVIGPGDSASGRDLDVGDRDPTQREVQLLGLIGQGRSNSEIAEELHVGPKTVKSYIRTAYRKIGAFNRSQAVSWATMHVGSHRADLTSDNADLERDPGESASRVA
jgi:DNA-binding NarL/FixJ family response regulator